MNNKIVVLLVCSIFLTGCENTVSFSSSLLKATAACAIAGAKISVKEGIEKKYKRSQCPVCKGKGWYISGDGIAKVECGYCEPETAESVPPRLLIKKK